MLKLVIEGLNFVLTYAERQFLRSHHPCPCAGSPSGSWTRFPKLCGHRQLCAWDRGKKREGTVKSLLRGTTRQEHKQVQENLENHCFVVERKKCERGKGKKHQSTGVCLQFIPEREKGKYRHIEKPRDTKILQRSNLAKDYYEQMANWLCAHNNETQALLGVTILLA